MKYIVEYERTLSDFEDKVFHWYLNTIIGIDQPIKALREYGESLIECSMKEWKEKQPYVIVIHSQTRAYTLDRGYELKDELIIRGNLKPKIYVEKQEGWRAGLVPAWALNYKEEEF